MKKPVSAARSEAARRNGARSRGPKTPEGKAISRLNAVTHGLTAKTMLLPGENEDRFQLLIHGLHLDHDPQSTTEALLIEQMAISAWRLRRSLGFERQLLTTAAEKIDHPDPEARAALAWASCPDARLLARYEGGHQRNFRQSLRELRALQREAPDQDLDDAPAEQPNEPNPPAPSEESESAPRTEPEPAPEPPAASDTTSNESRNEPNEPNTGRPQPAPSSAPSPGHQRHDTPTSGPYPRAA